MANGVSNGTETLHAVEDVALKFYDEVRELLSDYRERGEAPVETLNRVLLRATQVAEENAQLKAQVASLSEPKRDNRSE